MAKKKKKMGLPSKYAKLGFTLGWPAYKRAKAAAKRARAAAGRVVKKVKSKIKRKKKTAKKKTTAKKRTYNSKPKKRYPVAKRKSPKRTYSSKRPRFTIGKGQRVAIDSLTIGAGVLGSTAVMNRAPFVRDLRPWQKALTQFIVGVVGVVITPKKFMLVKKFFGGTAVGSVINFAPTIFPNLSLSGKNRTLSARELALVNMGIPTNINGNNNMGIPTNLGVPADLSGGGGRWRSRGHRSYAGTY